MTSPLRISAALLWLALAAAAPVLLLLSFIDFPTAAEKVHGFAVDGTADFFTPAYHAGLAAKLRWCAAVLGFAAAAIWVFRRRLLHAASGLEESVRSECRAAAAAAAGLLQSESRLHLAALIAIAVIGAAARAAYLDRPIFYDEAFTYLTFASKPLIFGLSNYSEPNNHLFHTLLLRSAVLLFGSDEWALRIPAFTAGVLLIFVTYGAARSFSGRSTGIAAAALVAGSSAFIEYSTLARGYTILCCLAILLFWLSDRLLAHSSGARWLAFTFTAALGLYTIPIFLFAYASAASWLLWESRLQNRPLTRPLFVSAAGTGPLAALLYLPPLLASGSGALFGNIHIAPKSWGYVAQELPRSLHWAWQLWHRDLPAALQYPLLFCWAAAAASKRGRRLLRLTAAITAASLVLLIIQRAVPYRRTWLMFAPVYYMTAGAGLAALARSAGAGAAAARPAAAAAAIVWPLLAGVYAWLTAAANPLTFHREQTTLHDAPVILKDLAPRLRPSDRIVASAPADAPLRYYALRRGLPDALFDPADSGTERLFIVENLEHTFSKSGRQQFLSVSEILENAGYSAELAGTAEKIHHYGYANVYTSKVR